LSGSAFERLQSIAPTVALVLFGLAVLLLLFSLRLFSKSRHDAYWRRRRAAGQRGWRLFVWSITLTFASGSICLATGVVGFITRPTRTPTRTLIANLPTETFPPETATPEPDTLSTATESQTEPATATRAPTWTRLPRRTVSPTIAVTSSFPNTATSVAATATPTEIDATDAANATGAGRTATAEVILSTVQAILRRTAEDTATQPATRRATLTRTRTPTPTVRTATPSMTASTTMTFTRTPTATATATLIPTSTASVTPTSTATYTATASVTATSTATPTATASATPTVTSSPTATATATDTPTATLSPTTTLTPTITPTVTDTLVPITILTQPTLYSSVTPAANASIMIIALDTQISENNGPVAPSQRFAAGFMRIYFFVTYSDMQSGVYWKRELLRNGTVIQANQYLWGAGNKGEGFFFFGMQGGFKPGNYEIRVYVGQAGRHISSRTFVVTGQ
jgi:hypothetical protein